MFDQGTMAPSLCPRGRRMLTDYTLWSSPSTLPNLDYPIDTPWECRRLYSAI